MFCVYCGCELRDDAKFCKKCGQPVARYDVYAEVLHEEEIKESEIVEKPIFAEEPITEEETVYVEEPVAVEDPFIEEESVVEEAPVPVEEPVEIPKPVTTPRIAEVPQNDSNNFAGSRDKRNNKKTANNGNDDSKVLTIVLIVVLVVALLIAAGAAIYILKSDSSEKKSKSDKETVQEYEDELSDEDALEMEEETSVSETSSDEQDKNVIDFSSEEEVVIEEEPAEEEIVFEPWDIDIEGECYRIYKDVDGYVSTKGRYDHRTLAGGRVNAYVYNDAPLVIEVESGFNGWNCDRAYYGIDDYYATLYDYDTNSYYEIFYAGGRTMRVIENGVVHDYNSENWAYYNEIGMKASSEKLTIKGYI